MWGCLLIKAKQRNCLPPAWCVSPQLYHNTSHSVKHLPIPFTYSSACIRSLTFTLTCIISHFKMSAVGPNQANRPFRYIKTHIHNHTRLPPVVSSHKGNLVKLFKSACWAGDYNAVLPTESQEPAKSCIRITPSSTSFPPLSMHFPSQGLILFPKPSFSLSQSGSFHYFSSWPPLLSWSPSLTFLILVFWTLFISLLPPLQFRAL